MILLYNNTFKPIKFLFIMLVLDKRISDRVKVTPKDWFNSITAKPIAEDKSVLNGALGKIILLTEFHNSWTREGMFIKDVPFSDYAFLERTMPRGDNNLRFNISLLNLKYDFLTKQDDSSYLLRVAHDGGGCFISKLDLFGRPNPHFEKYSEMINRAYTLPAGESIYPATTFPLEENKKVEIEIPPEVTRRVFPGYRNNRD